MTDRYQRRQGSASADQYDSLFGQRLDFEKTFPQIENVFIEVTEYGKGTGGKNLRSLDKTSLSEFIPCSNPVCSRGGFSIGFVIHEMVQRHQTEQGTTQMCDGNEGSGRIAKHCRNTVNIKVTIKYK